MYRTLVSCLALLVMAGFGCQSPTLSVATVSLPAMDPALEWSERRALITALVQGRAPDLLAVQGASAAHVQQLREQLRDYTCIASGAQDGAAAGDVNPIFVRNGRLSVTDYGHFWLSDTPREVGSRDWEAVEPRVATWVVATRVAPALGSVRVLSTRFDEQSAVARKHSAEVVRRFTEAFGSQAVVVAGEFGSTPGSDVHHVLTADTRFANPLKDVLIEDARRGVPAAAALAAAADTDRTNYMLVSQSLEVTDCDNGESPAQPGGKGVLFATFKPPSTLYLLSP